MKNVAAERRPGAILPLAVILLVLMLAMVAFSVDVGYLCVARTEIQTAADAGAMAGALGIPDGEGVARTLAQTAAQANTVASSPVVIVPQDDIELGVWNDKTFQFTPLTGSHPAEPNSVRVTCRRVASRGNAVPLFFARVFGRDTSEVSASAVARRKMLCGMFIGIDSADLNGNGASIDSYNSSLGVYTSQTPGNNGHLCSNGPVNVQNGVVNGNATPGDGYSVSIGSQGDVTGSTNPRTEPLNMPPVDFGNVEFNNDNDNLSNSEYNSTKIEFKHNGGGLNLPDGTYYFTDFSVRGGPITVHGQVTIYVRGNVSIGGDGLLNVTHKPANLKIYAEGRSVAIAGTSGFAGVVYAPSSDVDVGGSGQFYGAAVGKTLKFHNENGIHADEALLSLEEFSSQPRLVD